MSIFKNKNLNFISNSGDPLDDGGFKVSNYIKINDKVVKLDVRYVGDGYFDINWQKNILKDRRYYKGGYVPNKENFIYENENEKLYTSTINKYNLTDFLIIKNWFSYADLIGDKSYMEIFDFKINTNYLSEIQIKKIIARKKIN